jgi:hypothetical protein
MKDAVRSRRVNLRCPQLAFCEQDGPTVPATASAPSNTNPASDRGSRAVGRGRSGRTRPARAFAGWLGLGVVCAATHIVDVVCAVAHRLGNAAHGTITTYSALDRPPAAGDVARRAAVFASGVSFGVAFLAGRHRGPLRPSPAAASPAARGSSARASRCPALGQT